MGEILLWSAYTHIIITKSQYLLIVLCYNRQILVSRPHFSCSGWLVPWTVSFCSAIKNHKLNACSLAAGARWVMSTLARRGLALTVEPSFWWGLQSWSSAYCRCFQKPGKMILKIKHMNIKYRLFYLLVHILNKSCSKAFNPFPLTLSHKTRQGCSTK